MTNKTYKGYTTKQYGSLSAELVELRAENEQLKAIYDAIQDALEALYGASHGEEIPINLLPEDRQVLFHRVLELVGEMNR